MMHTLAKIGFTQSYTYFTWRNREGRARGVPPASWSHAAALHAAELLRQHAGHPARSTCSTAARRRSRSGPCSPRLLSPDLGRLLRLRAVRAPAGAAGQRGVPRLGEIPATPARLGRRPADGRSARAATSPSSTGSPTTHPALQQLRNLRFHRVDNRDHAASPNARRRTAGDDTVTRGRVNLDPHHAQEATVRLDMPALGLDWHDRVRRARRADRRDLPTGGRPTTSASTRTSSRRTSSP